MYQWKLKSYGCQHVAVFVMRVFHDRFDLNWALVYTVCRDTSHNAPYFSDNVLKLELPHLIVPSASNGKRLRTCAV